MDIEKLMIGDLVQYKNICEQDQICKVCNVSNLDNGIIFCQFKDGIYDIHQSTIQPIPLTGDILKKNGFEANDRAIWRIEVGIRCSYSKKFGENFINYSVNIEEMEEGGWFDFGINRCLWQGVAINYVHELQQALRLAGLSKMADNFQI